MKNSPRRNMMTLSLHGHGAIAPPRHTIALTQIELRGTTEMPPPIETPKDRNMINPLKYSKTTSPSLNVMKTSNMIIISSERRT